MGYSILKGKILSDTACEAIMDLEKVMVKSLRNVLKEEGNEFNTNGIIDVAVVFDECIIPSKYWQETDECYGLKKFAKIVFNMLNKYIKKEQKRSNSDWDGASNKKKHIDAYNKLLKRLSDFVDEDIE